VFYGRERPFTRDPALGRAIMDLARQYAATQQIYVAAEHVGPEARHEVFLRLFWVDADRRDYFAVLGFVVDPTELGARLFGAAGRSRIHALLGPRGGTDVPLQLRVTDERGTIVFGPTAPRVVDATVSFPMQFYPADDIQSRLAAGVQPRTWAIDVMAPATLTAVEGAGPGYWPTLVTIALMLVALGFTWQAHRRSEELTGMQRDFVAHVSHQLKTPLSALSAATETLQLDRVRSPEQRTQYLGIIQSETARLSSLVERVLEFSRLQQPRQYEFERVDLGALTRETVEAFGQGVSGPPVAFHVDRRGEGPFVRADPAALEQVVLNLLDNAVKYSDTVRDITVRIREHGTHAVVEVADRGVGIAPGDQARIFERFYRGSEASRRRGFGLGLPIVRELVHAHGGRVEVSSAPVSAPRSASRCRARRIPRHRAGRPSRPPTGGRPRHDPRRRRSSGRPSGPRGRGRAPDAGPAARQPAVRRQPRHGRGIWRGRAHRDGAPRLRARAGGRDAAGHQRVRSLPAPARQGHACAYHHAHGADQRAIASRDSTWGPTTT
jgi:signal transduction histidine kinase